MLPGGRAVVLTLASFTWLLGFSLAFERRFSVSVLWSMSKVLLMVTLQKHYALWSKNSIIWTLITLPDTVSIINGFIG